MTGLLLLVGVLLMVLSFVLGLSKKPQDLLYDLGVGVLIATGVSAALGLYIQGIERREEEGRRRLEHRIAEDQRARDEALHAIETQLDLLGSDLESTRVDTNFADMRSSMLDLAMLIAEVQVDVREIRVIVDPRYEHPNKAIVEAVLARLQEAQSVGEDLVSESATTHGEAGSTREG